MRQTSKGEGTKIAQAAKDLNVTSVTIRRYIAEFNIDTTSDENGIKVLPANAMEELHEIRRWKEEGLTNPKVMELLEERRLQPQLEKPPKGKEKAEGSKKVARRPSEARSDSAKKETKKAERKVVAAELEEVEEIAPSAPELEDEEAEESPEATDESQNGEAAGEGRVKHSLTCQTCGKTFEHMNPRLRDCLDCYRAKRKERRRGGGSDRHKNVIQHPLAQQVTNKNQQQQQQKQEKEREIDETFEPVIEAPVKRSVAPISVAPPAHRTGVRNYRKAVEETRQITSNLKRRLERPDLPEGDRRWLEQIYAYQLILHQGWRHLSEYKAGSQPQKPEV